MSKKQPADDQTTRNSTGSNKLEDSGLKNNPSDADSDPSSNSQKKQENQADTSNHNTQRQGSFSMRRMCTMVNKLLQEVGRHECAPVHAAKRKYSA